MRYLQPSCCLNVGISASYKLMNSELHIIFLCHSAKQIHVLKNGMTVLKQLALCSYPQKTTSTLSGDTSLFSLQDQDFLAKCLSEATTEWSAAKIRQVTKSWKVVGKLSNIL